MSDYLTMIGLGLIQGLTEFLPVSSSGHLVLFEEIFHVKGDRLFLNLLVHCGTLMAIIAYYHRDLLQQFKAIPLTFSQLNTNKNESELPEPQQYARLNVAILISMVPAAIVGFTLKKQVELSMESSKLVLWCLLITAAILWSTHFVKGGNRLVSYRAAMLIGVAQSFAILPGISRSGSTIALALWLGIARDKSARFSFLMSLPVIAGATLLEIPKVLKGNTEVAWVPGLLAFVAAAVSGYIAIGIIAKIVKDKKFEYFAIYCLAAAIVGFFFI